MFCCFKPVGGNIDSLSKLPQTQTSHWRRNPAVMLKMCRQLLQVAVVMFDISRILSLSGPSVSCTVSRKKRPNIMH